MSSPAAAGRTDLAVSLLTGSDMSAETIVSTLGKAPNGTVNAAMAGLSGQANPNLSMGGGDQPIDPRRHGRKFTPARYPKQGALTPRVI